MESSGAVIIPPIIGAAIRLITGAGAVAEDDGQKAGDDHRHGHGQGTNAQDGPVVDGGLDLAG